MARIYKDRIECDKSDPIIRIRSPAQVKYWTERAAAYRGMTLEELINELLYDRFHMISTGNNQYMKHNTLERVERRHYCSLRMAVANSKKRDAKLKDLATQKEKQRTAKSHQYRLPGIDWESYRKLRQDNIRRLLEDELELNTHLLPSVRQGKTPQELVAEAEKIQVWGSRGNTGGRRGYKNTSLHPGRVTEIHKLDAILPIYIDDGSQVPEGEPEIVDPIAEALGRR